MGKKCARSQVMIDRYKPDEKRDHDVYAVQRADHDRPYPDDPDRPDKGYGFDSGGVPRKPKKEKTKYYYPSYFADKMSDAWEVTKRLVIPVAVMDGINYGLKVAERRDGLVYAHSQGVLDHIDRIPEMWRWWDGFWATTGVWFADHHVPAAFSYIGWAIAGIYITNKYLLD